LANPDPSSDVVILLLAAGASRRMRGRDKLLDLIDGQPLLWRSATAAIASTATATRVILRPDDRARNAVVADLACTRLVNPDWMEGMASALRTGMQDLPPTTSAILIALADMPDITAADHNRLIAAHRADNSATIIRACSESGQPGHPVLFTRPHFPALAALTGDTGARTILAAHRNQTRFLRLGGHRAITDLDTPEDWAAYKAASSLF